MNYTQLFLTLALSFSLALFFGYLATRLHAPRVTGYLLAGIIVGPSLHQIIGWPELITREALTQLRPMSDIALAFIVLTIGIKCRVENIQRWGMKLVKLSAYEIGLTFLLVLISIFIIDWLFIHTFIESLDGSPVFKSFEMAVFFSIIAIATAPAATLFVVREYEADGPLTEKLIMLIGFNNLVAVAAFIIVSQLFFDFTHPVDLLMHLGMPVIIGGVAGGAMSFWAQDFDKERDYQLLLIAGVLATVGFAHWFHANMMLAVLIAGATLANGSPKIGVLTNAIQKIDYPIYVLFFFLSGAGMHLGSLAHVGILGLGYIVARTAGKLVGAWWGSRRVNYQEKEQKYLGVTLLAQAGVAIGLSQHLSQLWPEGGSLVESVILGSLIAFELGGPLAVRHGLVQAGEVSLISILAKKTASSAFEEFHQVINHFRNALGIHPNKRMKSPKDILVEHIMRRNVETVLASTHFNDFLKMLAYSRYDRFPVVDKENQFLGVVDYTDIRDMIFDPSLENLIIVEDLIKKNPLVVNEKQTVQDVMKIFKKFPNISYLPVVDSGNKKKLVGMINHNNVLSIFRSLNE